MFQVCKHNIMLPFVQEKSEDEHDTEMASDFRDSQLHFPSTTDDQTDSTQEKVSWEYIHTTHLSQNASFCICKLKVNYIYISDV